MGRRGTSGIHLFKNYEKNGFIDKPGCSVY